MKNRKVRAWSLRMRHLWNQGQVEIYKHPYPHIIVHNFFQERVAKRISEDFLYDVSHPSKNYEGSCGIEVDFTKNVSNHRYVSRVLKQYFYYDWIEVSDFCFDHLSNGDKEPSSRYRPQRLITCSYEPKEENTIIRDWHTDAVEKRYHIMMYMGDCKSGGEFEMRNKDGETKSIPFESNRLIIWKNTLDAEHRYRNSTDFTRQTISIPLEVF